LAGGQGDPGQHAAQLLRRAARRDESYRHLFAPLPGLGDLRERELVGGRPSSRRPPPGDVTSPMTSATYAFARRKASPRSSGPIDDGAN
jgi:hypothetical protein